MVGQSNVLGTLDTKACPPILPNVFLQFNLEEKLDMDVQTRPTVKVKGKEMYSSLQVKPAITATGNHIPYGITQCYLPPGRGDIPAFTPAEAGNRFSDPGGMQG